MKAEHMMLINTLVSYMDEGKKTGTLWLIQGDILHITDATNTSHTIHESMLLTKRGAFWPGFRAFFRDRESGSNLSNGKEFHAAGIVLEKVAEHCPSLKDMTVMYLDPFTGTIERAWRSVTNVVVYECRENEGVEWLDWQARKEQLEKIERIVNA